MNNLYLIALIIIILILSWFVMHPQRQSSPVVMYPRRKKENEKFQIYDRPCLKKIEESCYNDPLSSAKCWATKAFPCPKDNGSYMQCTNNFKRDVNIEDCLERTYYYSPEDERLSEKCVYKKVFPFAVKKDIPDNTSPSIFPRVNMWRNDDIVDNFFVAL